MSNPTILVENFNGSLGAFTGVDPIRYDAGLWVEQAGTNFLRNPRATSGTNWTQTRCTVATDGAVTKDGIPSVKLTVTDASSAVRAFVASENSMFTTADPANVHVFLRSGAAGRSATVSLVALTDASGVVTSTTQSSALATSGWTEFAIVNPSLSATSTRIGLQIEITGSANGNEIWIAQPQGEKLAYPTSYMDGAIGTGYAYTGVATQSASTRAASSASVTIAEPASVACWYREGYSGAKSFAYIEPYGTLGTYGSIAWSGGTLTLSTSRNLVIGPFAAFDRALTANEQANLRSTQNWSMNSVNGSNIILPLSGRRRPR